MYVIVHFFLFIHSFFEGIQAKGMDTRTVPKKCIQKNIYKKKETINKKE
jgi:hypothetical protein